MKNKPETEPGGRILIVDDNRDLHKDFKTILTEQAEDEELEKMAREFFGPGTEAKPARARYELDCAFQGREGVEKIKEARDQNRPFTLAFVDMRMPPGWDGLETIERLWKEDPDVQIVICTAYSDYSWEEITSRLGRTDKLLILKKPFDAVEVAQMASALTEKWRLTRQASMKMEEVTRRVDERTRDLQKANKSLQQEIAERRRAQEALVRAKEDAEAANRTKSEFLANMSHEIRTPMNAILGFCDLLARDIRDPKHRRFLASITSSGNMLLALINDLLDLSKIEAGKLSLALKPVNITAVFDEITQIFRSKVREKGLKLRLDIDPRIPRNLLLDEVRLRQVLFNLLGNAVKFTERGRIELRAGVRKQHESGGLELSFEIQDTGIGVPPEDQEKIFSAFEQSNSQDTRFYGGTGLGLAITRRLVTLMGGDIRLRSAPGQGSVFTVRLKNLTLGTDSPAAAAKAPDIRVPAGAGQPLVLVAEDDVSNRQLLREFLQDMGLRVTEAENGLQSLKSAQKEKPDLILMDIFMPVMDGAEAIARLRRHPVLKKVPVIVMTASLMDRDVSSAMIREYALEGYLTKPVKLDQLRLKLAELLPGRLREPGPEKTSPEEPPRKTSLPAAPELWAKIPEAVRQMEGPIAGALREALAHSRLSQYSQVAARVNELAREYPLPVLTAYARQLREAAGNCEVDRLNTILGQYGKLVEDVKKTRPPLPARAAKTG